MRVFSRIILCCVVAGTSLHASDWLQLRGPGAQGVVRGANLPESFGPAENLVWKTPLPPGHSSPVLVGDRIFLTAVEDDKLWTIGLNRDTGEPLWKVEAPRSRTSKTHKMNNAAAPSPVSDGENLYVFFGDFGLISYDLDGRERWRLPLGPFNNQMGMGASPVLADGKLLLNCDSDTGSYMMALDPSNGEIVWKTDRSEFTRGFATPIIYRPESGHVQAIVPGAFQLAGYALESGEKLWWARGLCWQTKGMAVLGDGYVYAHCWAAGGDNPPERLYPEFDVALAELDADRDGAISQSEFYAEEQKQFNGYDLDDDKKLDAKDWQYLRSKTSSQNALVAVRLGGRGDVTDTHVEWTYSRSLPNVASPLLYDGVLYLAKDGGIVSALNPVDGKAHKLGRLPGAMGKYFASPVAADGKIYFFDEEGTLSIVEAGPQWKVLSTVPLGEGGAATPAIADGRIYVRTHENLYCFGRAD